MTTQARILVVDDEEDVLMIARRILEKWGYIVDTFNKPDRALGHFERNSQAYDLILCDVRMPILSGFEFAALVRRVNPTIKLLLMTAFEADSDTLKQFLSTVKIDDMLKKPYVITDICKIVDRHLTKLNGR